MSFRKVALALSLLTFLALPVAAGATTITSFTTGAQSNTFAPGQSVTTPAGGPWNTLTFNWFNLAGAPNAVGTLFLLTQEYTGTPAGLSAATPGFLATTSSISGGMWLFNPAVTVQGATQYFFYSTTAMLVTGSTTGGYPGGDLYSNLGGVSYFLVPGQDANFALAGTAVPEPASLLLLGAGLAAFGLRRRILAR